MQQSSDSTMQEERLVQVERLHNHQLRPAEEGGRPYKVSYRPQASRRTRPITWLIATCCTIFWILVILGGLAVLIIYLVFRPKSPRFEISGVSLNGAYLDTGTLLNADVTILANFSNPNHKVDVSFSYLQLALYFQGIMVATQAVEPFAEQRGESVLQSVHMIASQVALPLKVAEAWKAGVTADGVKMAVAVSFRTRSNLGRWLHFTYWLHINCTLVVSAPPSGVLRYKHCRKRH